MHTGASQTGALESGFQCVRVGGPVGSGRSRVGMSREGSGTVESSLTSTSVEVLGWTFLEVERLLNGR